MKSWKPEKKRKREKNAAVRAQIYLHLSSGTFTTTVLHHQPAMSRRSQPTISRHQRNSFSLQLKSEHRLRQGTRFLSNWNLIRRKPTTINSAILRRTSWEDLHLWNLISAVSTAASRCTKFLASRRRTRTVSLNIFGLITILVRFPHSLSVVLLRSSSISKFHSCHQLSLRLF